jgi:hypothetical protein
MGRAEVGEVVGEVAAMKNPARYKGVIIEAARQGSAMEDVWLCNHLHGTAELARRCASRQRDRMYKVGSKSVLAHDSQRKKRK